MSELFPNAHGLKLWAIVVGCLIMAACAGAFLHSLYELWMSDRPKKKAQEPDEFQDRDDPFAVTIPYHIQYGCLQLVIFQSLTSMYDWATDNIPNIHRRAQFTLETIHAREACDKRRLLVGIVYPEMLMP